MAKAHNFSGSFQASTLIPPDSVGQGMAGAGLGGDAMLHVAELDLDALDVQAHQRAIGEGEDDDAGRRIRLLERQRPTD